MVPTELVLDASRCFECQQFTTPPHDGRWRWSRGNKQYPTQPEVEEAVARINAQPQAQQRGYEFDWSRNPDGGFTVVSRFAAAVGQLLSDDIPF